MSSPRRFLELAPYAAVCLVLVVVQWARHGWLYPASDDPYIYLGYVKAVLTVPPELFSYNQGEHSAGTTGLLYYYLLIVVCGLLRGILFFLPIERVLLLGLFATNVGLFVLAADRFLRAWRALVPATPIRPMVRGLLFLSFCAHPKFLWGAFSGLENPLSAFLALLVLERIVARAPAWQASLAAAGLGATRPETIPVLVLVPVLGALAESTRPPRIVVRMMASAAAFGTALVALALPCRLLTGRWFPSSLGTRVRVNLLEDPGALIDGVVGAIGRADYWTSEWLLLGYASVAASLLVFQRRRQLAPLVLAIVVLGFLALRAVLGLFDSSVEDRYVSYLWPLLALGFGLLLREAATPLAPRIGRAAGSAVAVVSFIVATVPLSEFLRRFELHVDLMDRIVVQPSWWMRDNLPAGSRVCMEPAGAIRVFTDFYLVDAKGLTTNHRHGFRGAYPRFLVENRIDYVFDRPHPGGQVVSSGLGREVKAWAVGVEPWGDVRLYELDPRVRGGP